VYNHEQDSTLAALILIILFSEMLKKNLIIFSRKINWEGNLLNLQDFFSQILILFI
jgi:hypothetical protein